MLLFRHCAQVFLCIYNKSVDFNRRFWSSYFFEFGKACHKLFCSNLFEGYFVECICPHGFNREDITLTKGHMRHSVALTEKFLFTHRRCALSQGSVDCYFVIMRSVKSAVERKRRNRALLLSRSLVSDVLLWNFA